MEIQNHFGALAREEYEEPRCLLCDVPRRGDPAATVPQGRIMEKLDEYMARRDLAGAERHLLYWLAEARAGGDERGEFLIRNELMGHYRKTGNRERAIENAEAALALAERLGFGESTGGATAFVNAATVYDAFGEPGRALPLFERARGIYTRLLPPGDARLGGLYNNMGLALTDLRRFGEAYEAYQRALSVMRQCENGALEEAVTQLNIANAVEAEHGLERGAEKIEQCLELAEALLEQPELPRNGYYAFVCEKCAPTFAYYGYFALAEELERRAEAIYAGT